MVRFQTQDGRLQIQLEVCQLGKEPDAEIKVRKNKGRIRNHTFSAVEFVTREQGGVNSLLNKNRCPVFATRPCNVE